MVRRARLAVHADWSVDPRKRWMTLARESCDRFAMQAPLPAPAPAMLAATLLAHSKGGPVALGIDAPIGLPRAYAVKLPDQNFIAFLRRLNNTDAFFQVAATLEEVSLARPFYPARGKRGMTRAAHAEVLALENAAALSRACDRATALRPAGAPLFWTLGANQTGKAAITLWRDALIGARAHPGLKLWPFEGAFLALLAPDTVVMAETYPAESMRALGIFPRGSKRRQQDRAAQAEFIAAAMRDMRVTPSRGLRAALDDGFGGDAAGEDRFDSILGALGVIAVLRGALPDAPPENDGGFLTRWEGWVLGQTALPLEHDRFPCFNQHVDRMEAPI
jgi:hypothetical protein